MAVTWVANGRKKLLFIKVEVGVAIVAKPLEVVQDLLLFQLLKQGVKLAVADVLAN